MGSTATTFVLSHKLSGHKFDPFHIANATLAGGVSIGASARLDMTPGGALLLGCLAGAVSVGGYFYISPRVLEARLGIYDTCGVHSLHGMPSVLGGLASAIFVTLDANAPFLEFGQGQQALHQILAVVCTVVFAVASGLFTGFVMVKVVPDTPWEYDDAEWWKADYLLEDDFSDVADKSNHSHGSVLPLP